MSLDLKLYVPLRLKTGIGLIFPEKQTCVSQKPVAAFLSVRFLANFFSLLKKRECQLLRRGQVALEIVKKAS